MTDFIRRQNLQERVPRMLASQVVGFTEAPEYREMREYELNIPDVVCSRFANYLQRLHEERLRGVKSDSAEQSIRSAHEVLNLLASSHETETLVTEEVFEALDCTPNVLAEFTSSFGPAARRLFEEWRAK